MFLRQNLEQSSHKLKTTKILSLPCHFLADPGEHFLPDPGEFKIITIVFLVFMKLLEAH